MSSTTERAIGADVERRKLPPVQPYGQQWGEYAATTGLRVFPVYIVWNGRKWDKRPLVNDWVRAASPDVSRFDWSRANGFGIATGHGLYAFDLDSYKQGCAAEQWLHQWKVPTPTRTHQTVSGGLHMLYHLPDGHHYVRTRQNVVKGLDTRGAGGFIAFGEGYRVLDTSQPAVLPVDVCVELDRPTEGGDVTLRPVLPVDGNAVLAKLQTALTFGRGSLRHRWAGGTHELNDDSASGFDMSVAKLLANERFTYHEIYWVLTTQFTHGVVARDGLNRTTERQIMRAAARVTQNAGVDSALVRRAFE